MNRQQENVLRLKLRIERLEAALRCLGCGWLVDEIERKEKLERSFMPSSGGMTKLTVEQSERDNR